MLISALTDRPTRAEGALESDRTLADPGFFDGLILGSILLGGAFISVYVGFFLVPAFWIVLLCGWPLIIVTLVSFELWKRYSRSEVMRGKGLPFMTPRTTKSCPYCGTWVHVEATVCPGCGIRLLPTYRTDTPPPRFCLVCGTMLEGAMRYGRGWCPRCEEYR